jgi:hypothetical protein
VRANRVVHSAMVSQEVHACELTETDIALGKRLRHVTPISTRHAQSVWATHCPRTEGEESLLFNAYPIRQTQNTNDTSPTTSANSAPMA